MSLTSSQEAIIAVTDEQRDSAQRVINETLAQLQEVQQVNASVASPSPSFLLELVPNLHTLHAAAAILFSSPRPLPYPRTRTHLFLLCRFV